jgi:hypothetical protein
VDPARRGAAVQHRLSASGSSSSCSSCSGLCCVGHAHCAPHCVGLPWNVVHATVCLVCIAWVVIIDWFGLVQVESDGA